MPSSRQDSDGGKCGVGLRGLGLGRSETPSELTQSPSCSLSEANSVASYENEGASGAPGALVAGRLGPGLRPDRCVVTPEHLSCEDNDEDEEEEYHNEGYL